MTPAAGSLTVPRTTDSLVSTDFIKQHATTLTTQYRNKYGTGL